MSWGHFYNNRSLTLCGQTFGISRHRHRIDDNWPIGAQILIYMRTYNNKIKRYYVVILKWSATPPTNKPIIISKLILCIVHRKNSNGKRNDKKKKKKKRARAHLENENKKFKVFWWMFWSIVENIRAFNRFIVTSYVRIFTFHYRRR